MAEFLDMSLDEIIKKNKKHGRRDHHEQHHQRGGRSRVQKRRCVLVEGPSRRHRRSFNTNTPLYYVMPPQLIPEQEMNGMTKLFVSNLDYGVSNDDLWLLFSDVGELHEYGLHFDRNGKSMGTAEVVFAHHADALAAVKRFNNMQLDGRPIKIEVVGVNVQTHQVPAMPYFAPTSPPRGTFQRPGVAAYGRDQDSRRGEGMIEPGGFTERRQRRRISAKDLDADLDKYRSGAVKIK